LICRHQQRNKEDKKRKKMSRNYKKNLVILLKISVKLKINSRLFINKKLKQKLLLWKLKLICKTNWLKASCQLKLIVQTVQSSSTILNGQKLVQIFPSCLGWRVWIFRRLLCICQSFHRHQIRRVLKEFQFNFKEKNCLWASE
jgi:hypothetical protein